MMTFWYYRPDDIQSQNPTTECVGVSCIPMACKNDASKQNLLLRFLIGSIMHTVGHEIIRAITLIIISTVYAIIIYSCVYVGLYGH